MKHSYFLLVAALSVTAVPVPAQLVKGPALGEVFVNGNRLNTGYAPENLP